MERKKLEQLAAENQLMAYQHDGFFHAVDTYREYSALHEMWSSGHAPVESLVMNLSFWHDRPSLVTDNFVMNRVFWIGLYPGITEAMVHHMIDVFKSFVPSLAGVSA